MPKMRALGVSVASLALTTVVIANAYYQKKQFYPSVVYITKSNPSMAVIYLQALICVIIAGKIMRKVFFGQLRTAEFEHLMERSWYAITETCLAFTVFRDDFNPKFVALFTLLLFLKSFHWLVEDRVDYMERSPVISWLFHVRVLSLLLLLSVLDFHFIQHAYLSTISKGASVQLVFGFEYAILMTVVTNITIKYALHFVDLNSEVPWDNKAVFLLYTELVMGLFKVLFYIAFVGIMVRLYTLPLFAFRPMYYTLRNFKKAFNDVILSRRAIHNMNTLYPDATPEELQAADNVCIICREEMTTASKKLPCNHIFHSSCLRSWFQRQQTCPTCRLNILRTPTGHASNAARDRANRQNPNPAANQFFNAFAGQNPFQFLNLNANNMPQAAPGQPQNAAPNVAPNVGGAAAGQAAPNAAPFANMAFTMPTFPLPPFPFLPFMAPPPMPPQNLQNLSAEELRRMEGNERENIEARIQCLRNIQVMLDAAVIMMQQYTAAATISQRKPQPSAVHNPTSTDPQPSTSSTASAPSSAASAPSTADSPQTNADSNDVIKPTTAATSAAPEVQPSTSHAPSADTAGTSKEVKDNGTVLPPEEELRRRRLEKFQNRSEAEQ